MPFARATFVALGALSGALTARHAAAQTVTLGDNVQVQRANPRSSREDPESINLKDCQDDVDIAFPLSLTNFAGSQLEFWVSSTADCASRTTRLEQQDPPRCTEIADADTPEDDNPTYHFTATQILQGQLNGAACEDYNGSSSKTPLRLHFLLVQNPDEETSPSAVWESNFDLIGPSPPTNLSAGGGEDRIIVAFTPSSATGVNGYQAFCDAALSYDEGSCAAPGLTPGEVPSDNLECGDMVTGGTSNEVVVDGRSNGTRYAVGVSAVDDLGNVGPLSADIVCATPQEVTGFYEAYRAAGGNAGGTLCAFKVPARAATSAWLGLLGLGVLAGRRAARRGDALGRDTQRRRPAA